jgi:peptidyl-dipeptidase A
LPSGATLWQHQPFVDAPGVAMDERFGAFVREHVAVRQPLETEAALAWWEAATTGEPEAYRRGAALQTRIESLLANRESFELLRGLKSSGGVADPLEHRLLEVLYLAHLGRQCSEELLAEIVRLSTDLEERFATFRAELDGERLTQNEIEQVLAQSSDPVRRRAVWEASKSIGPAIADDVRRLVRLRNRAARELGFDDYHRMALSLEEQPPAEIEALFDELDARTREPHRKIKEGLDREIAAGFGITPSELRPWHYSDPFFQEVPLPEELRLDDLFAGRDLLQVARTYFDGIGLDVSGILERSDVEEREGKNQHAFCIDIDREGDVRALLNLCPTVRWMSTVLHELGHGLYDLGIRGDLPYPLRCPSHTFVTEGVAMFFGRLPYTAPWLERMELTGDRDLDGLRRSLQAHQVRRQLVFSRWCQVVVRFEKALYADPDGPLHDRWWELVERYQGVRRPEGREGADWATKIHIVSTPVYYHNYAIGEMFASQLLRAVLDHLGDPAGDEGSLVDDPAVGEYLRERVFAAGASRPWPLHVEDATARPLSVGEFFGQYARDPDRDPDHA